MALIRHHSHLTIQKKVFPGRQFDTKTGLLPREFHDLQHAEGSGFRESGDRIHQRQSGQRLLDFQVHLHCADTSEGDFIGRQWKPVQWVMCLPLREMSFYCEAFIRPQSGPCSPVWLSQTWLLMSASSSSQQLPSGDERTVQVDREPPGAGLSF